jgi:hypothetical protein
VVVHHQEGVPLVGSREQLEEGSKQQLLATGHTAPIMTADSSSVQHHSNAPSNMHMSDGFLVVR